MGVRVHQSDEDKLHCTVRLAAGNLVEVVQDTAADLNATVTQAAKDRTVTGSVTVTQATAANLNATVQQKSPIDVEQANSDLLIATVVQSTASHLKATVAPSGDMARKAPYDRNATNITNSLIIDANYGAHGSTTRMTYTVPTNKILLLTYYFSQIVTAIATAGKEAICYSQIKPSGGSGRTVVSNGHYSMVIPRLTLSSPTPSYLFEGDQLLMRTYSNDTIGHLFSATHTAIVFDE